MRPARSRAAARCRASAAPPRRSARPRRSRGASPSSREAMSRTSRPSRARARRRRSRARRLQRRIARAARGRASAAACPLRTSSLQSSRLHIIIFSMGTTRIAEAPAAFSFCSVSQKTDSWQTAWTAKWPGRPASGKMVGASAPGSDRGDPVERLLGRVQHDIFAISWVASTPSIRLSSCSRQSRPAPPASGLRVRTSTASLSSTVSTRPQAIGLQRRAGRDQVADEAGDLQPRRQLDRAAHLHDLSLDPRSRRGSAEQARIGGGDPRAGQALRARHKPSPPARRSAARIGRSRAARPRRAGAPLSSSANSSSTLLADDAELADAVADEGRDVVVADEHQVGGEILDPRGRGVLARSGCAEPASRSSSRLASATGAPISGSRCAGGFDRVSIAAPAAGRSRSAIALMGLLAQEARRRGRWSWC